MSTPTAPTGRAEDTRAEPEAGDREPSAREVLVGVDSTESAVGAARWAAQEAGRRRAPLRILHAAPYLSRRGPTGSPPPELARARGITAVAYTAARHSAPAVRASTEVVPSDPTTALLRAATAAQLVVLGSSTRGAADELVLAPVALRVAARSPQPVVVVPRRRGGEPVNRPVVAVLGVGDRADDEAVAAFASTFVQRSGGTLSALQTRPAGRAVTDSWVTDADEWDRRFPGLDVELRALPAARANQVLSATCPAPLLVISAGRGHLMNRTLDGPHRWLLRHCTSPMALIPPVERSATVPREEIVAVG
jgi:nucleotide-binding universal stress UspA family protein